MVRMVAFQRDEETYDLDGWEVAVGVVVYNLYMVNAVAWVQQGGGT